MSDLTKQCWSCEATTPYEQGWCTACWYALPESIKEILKILQETSPPAYSGPIRLTIADTLRQLQRPRVKPKPRINLEDLDIGIDL